LHLPLKACEVIVLDIGRFVGLSHLCRVKMLCAPDCHHAAEDQLPDELLGPGEPSLEGGEEAIRESTCNFQILVV
jgi:hypothetical protein